MNYLKTYEFEHDDIQKIVDIHIKRKMLVSGTMIFHPIAKNSPRLVKTCPIHILKQLLEESKNTGLHVLKADTSVSKNIDPINGITYEKGLHLFDTEKVIHSKDDVKGIKRGLRKLNYKITGKNAFDENGNHKGFKCSAKCRPDLAEGHNRRDKNWVEKLEHVSKDGSY